MRWIPGLLLIAITTTAASAADQPAEVRFNEHIRPILSANCFACHGFDQKQRKAELRLDVAEGAYAERSGGAAAIKPGSLAGSDVWNRIISDDPDVVMPPPSTKRSLTPEQKQLIRRWIEQGAKYEKHWAFETPARQAAPAVNDPGWVKNAIDRFILARLEREKLAPQPEADRETLIRRVSFALTGLPPTVQEVDQFLSDQAPNAYERMVDRYLASRHFGEEQARLWLDVARYADTHGLHLDNERQMWAYRDWVVKAFNENLPFDRFTTWQLAGDLLPDASLDQLVATGFNRCNVSTSEGGSIGEEWVFRNAVDRTSTMIQTWMGLTGGCAVCHDHKYDPLSAKEFYSLYAFFYSAADPGLDGNVRHTAPFQKVPTPEQAAQLKHLSQEEALAKTALEEALAASGWKDPVDGDAATQKRRVRDVWLDDDFPLGAKVTNTSRNASDWLLDPDFGTKSGRRVLELASSDVFDTKIDSPLIPLIVPAESLVEVWLRIDPNYPPQTLNIQFNTGKQNARVAWGEPGSDGAIIGPMPSAGEWVRLEFPLEKAGLKPGDRINQITLSQKGGRVWFDALICHGEIEAGRDPRRSFKDWWQRSAGRDLPELPEDLRPVLKAGPDKEHTPEQRERLQRFFLVQVLRAQESPAAGLHEKYEAARVARIALEDSIPGTFIFKDLPQPRETFVMLRGQYDKPGEKVEPAVPAVFPALKKSAPEARATRLDLAQWLLAPDHPLTARVQVNRVWQQLFGTGLVKTSYDFGSQGEVPSHPELLDWLAVTFRESGWDQKGLLKRILTSATFRQSSATGVLSGVPEAARQIVARDPENRLLARGPRFRLDAEQIRDNALFVSGLLNPQMGGRGIMPYQPLNIWEPVGYQNSNTRYYMQDHGPALYRRSLYCFLKRTAPPPFMSNFDGPNREQFCTRRERSNTPLQALQLMNDVQHFEASRALAERVLTEGGRSPEERLTFLYRVVLARRPDRDETGLLMKALARQQEFFAADPESARRAVHTGESTPKKVASDVETATWTMLANLVMNLDETVTRN